MPSRARNDGWPASAGDAAWRLLSIGALVVATIWLAERVLAMLLPGAVALLLAALLGPLAAHLTRRGAPPASAAALSLAALVCALAAALALIVPPFVARLSDLVANLQQGSERVVYTLGHDVAGISRARAHRAVEGAIHALSSHRGRVAGEVLAAATVVATAVGGAVLALFLAFFMVRDGEGMWRWLVGLVPADQRGGLDRWGRDSFARLGTYIRGIYFVATVDALFIGLALVLVGVPLRYR